MTRGRRQDFSPTKLKGQSLVEVAIFLPILLFILVGVVEVGNLMNTQNRVTTASRAAAGFGATNIDSNDPMIISNTLNYMGLVVRNTVTETLDLSPELWDIWSIYAQTDITGTNFTVFTATQVYGTNNVVPQAEWTIMVQEVRDDVLNSLNAECTVDPNCAGDIEVVASVPYHNLDTILGIPIWQWTGFRTIRGLTVMRIGERAVNTGCPLIPIAVHLDQYSLYPWNWTCGAGDPPPCNVADWRGPWNSGSAWYNQDPVYKFPSTFTSPNPPTYTNNITNTLILNSTDFKENLPGTPLQMAQGTSGNIYQVTEGTGPGSFGWLTWDGNSASLTYPGDFLSKYPGGQSDLNLGDGNGILDNGEWLVSSGVSRIDELQEYIGNEYKPAIIIYDHTSGPNFQVYGFANVEILGYNSGENWILIELVQWPAEQCFSQPTAYVGP